MDTRCARCGRYIVVSGVGAEDCPHCTAEITGKIVLLNTKLLRSIGAFKKIYDWRESGNFCCITIKSDYHYCWRIEVTPHGAEPHEPGWGVDGYENLWDAVDEMERVLRQAGRL